MRVTFVQYLIAFCSRPEVVSDVISSANVGQVCLDVPVKSVKFGDSRSNRSRDIAPLRLPHFVTNDNDDNDAGVRRSSLKINVFVEMQIINNR